MGLTEYINKELIMELSEIKIIADSSADLLNLKDLPYSLASLKIITSEKEYIDNKNLDVEEMVGDLQKYSGKSSTACPAPGDWMNAFGEAKYIFCVTITSALSGSYNSAIIAKSDYEGMYPDRKVVVFDSLSTGPEMQLIIEKIVELAKQNLSFEEITDEINKYNNKTALLFMLKSMRNLANNGRVNPIVAKAAGLLGIRIVGKASDKGTLELTDKCKGEKKAVAALINKLKEIGYKGGKIKIGHCFNEELAITIKKTIETQFENSKPEIYPLRGLCSFYAEKGGILMGFET